MNIWASVLTDLEEARKGGTVTGYAHPLGFDHIAVPSRGKHKVRLHVWSCHAAEARPLSIHNHSFRFVSLILRGAVSHTPYYTATALTATGSRDIYEVRRVVKQGDDTLLIDTGARVIAKAGIAVRCDAGHHYGLREAVFHASGSVGSDPAMTLIVAKRVKSVTSYVLSDPRERRRLFWRTEWLGPEQVDDHVACAIERLRALNG